MRNILGGLAAVLAVASASSASAAFLSGTGGAQTDAAVAGGVTVDFEATPISTFGSTTIGGLTLTGLGGDALLDVENTYGGLYNTSGRYLANNGGATDQIVFDFAGAVTAFTFNMGATDIVWALAVYNGATLIDTVALNPVFGSNAGDYYGYAAAGITRATLSPTHADFHDQFFVDNVSYAGHGVLIDTGGGGGGAVPEPATWALMLLGFGGLGAMLRHRRAAAGLIAG